MSSLIEKRRTGSPRAPAPKPKPIVEVPRQEEPDREDMDAVGQRLLWCPFAERATPMRSRGKYEKNYPLGAVVHYTAGRSMKSSLNTGLEGGLLFWGIAKDGTIYQPNPLNEWGYHAGKSQWPGLGSSVSRHLVGIEIDCAGLLTKTSAGSFKAWYGKEIYQGNVRTVPAKDNVARGHYEKYTPEQEESLINLLLWLKRNNPEVFNLDFVVGHDEVARGRKVDPGGSLSMTMPELREKLKKLL